MTKNDYTQIDTLLKRTADAENAALPYDSWKGKLLSVATETPEHEVDIISMFEERAARKRKIISRATYTAAACAAVFLIMLTASFNQRMHKKIAPQQADSADAPAPKAASAEEIEAMGLGGESAVSMLEDVQEAPQMAALEPEIDDLLLESGSTYAASTPSIEAPVGREDEAIQAVLDCIASGADKGSDLVPPTAELFTDETFLLTPLGGGEQFNVILEYAYVVTLESGERYIVDANGFSVTGILAAPPTN